MSLRRPLLVVCLLGLVACGRGPAEVKVLSEQERRGAVSGIVRRAGVPVPGAQVRVAGRSVTTDAAGAYRVEGVVPGSHRLEARDPGDDTPTCAPDGTCVSGRSVAEAAVTVVVPPEGGDVRADVDL